MHSVSLEVSSNWAVSVIYIDLAVSSEQLEFYCKLQVLVGHGSCFAKRNEQLTLLGAIATLKEGFNATKLA